MLKLVRFNSVDYVHMRNMRKKYIHNKVAFTKKYLASLQQRLLLKIEFAGSKKFFPIKVAF